MSKAFFFKGFGEGRDIGLTQRSKRGKNNFLIVTSCLAYGVDFAGKLQWNLKFEKNKIPMCPLSSPLSNYLNLAYYKMSLILTLTAE